MSKRQKQTMLHWRRAVFPTFRKHNSWKPYPWHVIAIWADGNEKVITWNNLLVLCHIVNILHLFSVISYIVSLETLRRIKQKSVIQEVLQHSSKHSVVQTWIKMGVPRGVHWRPCGTVMSWTNGY